MAINSFMEFAWGIDGLIGNNVFQFMAPAARLVVAHFNAAS